MQKTKPEALCRGNAFEHLRKYGNLYSIKIKTKDSNIRVLYSYNGEGKIILNSFYEKSGKKATSYDKYAPIAIERRKELLSQ